MDKTPRKTSPIKPKSEKREKHEVREAIHDKYPGIKDHISRVKEK